jgi:hypothetical protein
VIISRRKRWEGDVGGYRRGKYKVLMGRRDGKKLLGRARRRWENSKMDLEE